MKDSDIAIAPKITFYAVGFEQAVRGTLVSLDAKPYRLPPCFQCGVALAVY